MPTVAFQPARGMRARCALGALASPCVAAAARSRGDARRQGARNRAARAADVIAARRTATSDADLGLPRCRAPARARRGAPIARPSGQPRQQHAAARRIPARRCRRRRSGRDDMRRRSSRDELAAEEKLLARGARGLRQRRARRAGRRAGQLRRSTASASRGCARRVQLHERNIEALQARSSPRVAARHARSRRRARARRAPHRGSPRRAVRVRAHRRAALPLSDAAPRRRLAGLELLATAVLLLDADARVHLRQPGGREPVRAVARAARRPALARRCSPTRSALATAIDRG